MKLKLTEEQLATLAVAGITPGVAPAPQAGRAPAKESFLYFNTTAATAAARADAIAQLEDVFGLAPQSETTVVIEGYNRVNGVPTALGVQDLRTGRSFGDIALNGDRQKDIVQNAAASRGVLELSSAAVYRGKTDNQLVVNTTGRKTWFKPSEMLGFAIRCAEQRIMAKLAGGAVTTAASLAEAEL